MNIVELNEIISQIDLPKIRVLLERRGYRLASKNGQWEFSPVAIANAKNVENSDRYEDVFDDKIYVADVHSDVKEYPDVEFIVVTVNQVCREKDNLEQPIEMLLFTNAPIDEEYERAQSSIAKCDICKKQFTMSELCEVNGKLVCGACFEEDLNRLIKQGKSKLAKKTKRRKNTQK